MTGGLAEPQDMFQLTCGNQDGSAGRETDNDGMGDEIDQCSQSGQAECQLIDPGQKGQGQNEPNVLFRAWLGKRADGAEYNDGNRRGRTGYQMQGGTEERCDNRGDNGCIEPVFRGKPGNHRKGHSLRKDDDRPGQPGQNIGPQGVPTDEVPPAKKGKESAQTGYDPGGPGF